MAEEIKLGPKPKVEKFPMKTTVTIFAGPGTLEYRSVQILESRDGYVKLRTREGNTVQSNGFPFLVYEELVEPSVLVS